MRAKSFRTAAKLLSACAAAAIAIAFTPVSAVAQEDSASVPTIIVTAQRRNENMQDVPIAVSAVSGKRMDELLSAGGDVLQLAGRAPGLNVESSNGRVAPRFYIRGLGNTDFDLAASQPVSVIMDDVVMENVVLKSFPIFDIEQVEVLRGPQGTLYGRNTPAGIVNFRSVRPSGEKDVRGSFSFGSFGTLSAEGAMNFGNDTLAARAAVSWRRREDWVDNTFTGEEEALGSYDDLAGRVQVLWNPTDAFSALLNVHGRDYDGTSTLFRANIFTAGSNNLNGNFDRDSVFYNGGGGNPQTYKGWGSGLTLTYDFGGMVLTSITGYETTDGRSRGDIDGGVAGVGPGFIPFDSDTQDGLDDLEQTTQEVRLASDTDGRLNWQVGAYWFDSDLQITTVGFAFPPATTLNHTNESWAVFGQIGYQVSDDLTLTAGVRYTEDEKDMTGVNVVIAPVNVSDEQVSWDLSAVYELSEDVNVYARVATGFRAPTIQGRDVAFFSPPSVADSETITSGEIGFKSDLLGRTVRLNGDIFYYEIEDQQFSAIGGLGNFNQLVNADKGVGYGYEIEGEFAITPQFFMTAAVTYNHTEIDDPTLAIAPCGSGQCTVLDPPAGLGNVFIDGNSFPQAPEFTFDLTARYDFPLASGANWYVATDWTVRGEMNIFLYEATEFRTDTQFEGGLALGYESADGRWDASIFARNITDEENVIGAIDFNNLTGFVNEPRVVGIALRARMY